ncbi:MAG: DUF547 domain-containing protein [Bacteroidota bacterium]
MRKILLFILIFSALVYSCTNSPQKQNTKTETATVNNETSQPIVTTEKPITTTPPEEDEQSDTPTDPLPPSGEAVVTKTNTPRTDAATNSSPSPDRTNVSPAKEVAEQETPDVPPSTAIKPNPPSTRNDNTPSDSPSAPPTTNSKSEEVEDEKASDPPASSDVKEEETKPQNPPALSHQAWDELLKKYVTSSGKVNYTGFKGESAKLEGYLKDLQNNPPQSSWSRNKTMAYWINAYNAFTVKLIVDNYPVSSITKLDGGKPWDRKWISIGGKSYSLNNIENDILRPTYKDARIHFAVNCAAKSCPPLLNRAWTADNLIANFEKQAKSFINNSTFNKVSSSKISVSKIFEWYKEDFGNLIDYLNKYSSEKINQNAKVEFMEYNWQLNN